MSRRTIRSFVVLVLGAATAASPNLPSRADPVQVLSPDLAFHFVCKGKEHLALEDDIGVFLRRQGFKVLNQGRIQHEHGFDLTDLKIIGLDDKRRMVRIIAVPFSEGRYSVGLNTPPPTRHDPQLEDALLAFASKTLGCHVRQVTRGENAADAREFYNAEVKRTENLFQQAERLRGERRL
jgi:hypothetical protein